MNKNMLNIFLIVSLLFFVGCSVFVPVVVGYEEQWISGSWDTSGYYPNYVDLGLNRTLSSGIKALDFDYVNLTNLQGLEVNFTINSLRGERYEWWWINGVKRFWCAIDLTDGSTHGFNKFYIAHEQGILLQTMQMKVGSQEVVPYTNLFSGAFDTTTDLSGLDFSLQVMRINDTVCSIYLLDINDDIRSTDMAWSFSKMVWNETFTVSPTFWNNAQFKVYIAHEGCGVCDVTFTGMEIKTLDPYQRFDYGSEGGRGTWLDTAWAVLTGLYSVGTTLFSLVSTLVVTFAPILPYVFLAWVFDAVVSSVATQSFKPLGTFFQKILDFIVKVYQMLASFVSAIGEILPF